MTALPTISLFPKLYELTVFRELSSPSLEPLVARVEAFAAWDSSPKLPGAESESSLFYYLLEFRLTIQYLTLDRAAETAPSPKQPSLRLIHLWYNKPPSSEILQWLVPEDSNSLRIPKVLPSRWSLQVKSTIQLAKRKVDASIC